jgi:hypothetical protein
MFCQLAFTMSVFDGEHTDGGRGQLVQDTSACVEEAIECGVDAMLAGMIQAVAIHVGMLDLVVVLLA